MIPDQNSPIASILRTLGASVATWVAAKGYLDGVTAEAVVGALITLALAAWGAYAKRTTAIVASAAAKPEVGQIIASPAVANSVPSAKVVDPAGKP